MKVFFGKNAQCLENPILGTRWSRLLLRQSKKMSISGSELARFPLQPVVTPASPTNH